MSNYFISGEKYHSVLCSHFNELFNSFVADLIPPVCGEWTDITDTVPVGNTSTPVSWTEQGAADNCGPATRQSRSHKPGDSFGPGNTQVTYVYADDSGNTVSCGFCVTITITQGMYISVFLYLVLCKAITNIIIYIRLFGQSINLCI